MSNVTTPSQLKAEIESQKDTMLKACLYAFNQIPNRRLQGGISSTYALAAQIEKLLKTAG
ncbi:cobalamin biosynthesis protein CbiX [Serratia quinivorans]|uniref:cobalamin biosynthesis protein CbiX n=1 Tax=Serratia quinivorans TaxID=137545 RepID=UPI0034C5F615